MAHRVPIAVFDLDGTLLDGQSGALFSTYLLRHQILTLRPALRLGWWGARYKAHLPLRQDESREVIFRALMKSADEDVETIMQAFHDEAMLPRYRPEAVHEVRRRKDEGCVTLLASATFHDVAACAADHLGFDGFVATEMEQDDLGFYTGFVEGEVAEGRGKVVAAVEWANERYGQGNWYFAYAYGDHNSDIPLLAASKHPIAVCPSYLMKLHARKLKWETLYWGSAR